MRKAHSQRNDQEIDEREGASQGEKTTKEEELSL